MKFHTIPLSLYIHIPWCVKKCPYCDFNSHAQTGELPEKKYIEQMLLDLETQLPLIQDRPIHTIFIGGGTPSLFSPAAYADLFSQLRSRLTFSSDCEVTLEANPGTMDEKNFSGYHNAGINRISIGVQSFQDEKLKSLGRIHQSDHAQNAVAIAKRAGFKRINIDLMFGLPNQTLDDALFDLQTGIDLDTSHLSWYQLTLEPNTFFYRFPPTLPDDDFKFELQHAGQTLLSHNGFAQYEISAYSKNDPCRHNLNYWLFGDYAGIGAGAHAKLTDLKTGTVIRRNSIKHPTQYLKANHNNIALIKEVNVDELPLEFMMNALRLFQKIPIAFFESRTGLSFDVIKNKMEKARGEGLMDFDQHDFWTSEKGKWFLNEVLEMWF